MIELLAGSASGEPVRFSDVARRLALTQGTAHAILTTLCQRGWVSRDPADKTFSLGPALAVVAARVDAARPRTHAARSIALELSDDLGFATSVLERVDDSLVITAFENRGPQHGAPGDRIHYAPPFGVAFAAWDPPDAQRAWMQRSPAFGPELAQRLDRLLAHTRERGYDVDWTTPALTRAAQVVTTLSDEGLPDQVREITDRLLAEFSTIGLLSDDDSTAKAQPVAMIAAPVFDHHHRVALIVAVHPLEALTNRRVDQIGQRVARAAASISDS